jgi:hypothetical protein
MDRLHELHGEGAVDDQAHLLLCALESGAPAGDPQAPAFLEWASGPLGPGGPRPVTLAALLGAAGGPGPALWLRWLRAFVARTRLGPDELDFATATAARLTREAAPGRLAP